MQQKENSLYWIVALCQKSRAVSHLSFLAKSDVRKWELFSTDWWQRDFQLQSTKWAAVSQERHFLAVWALELESPESNYSPLAGLVLRCLDTTVTTDVTIYHFSAYLTTCANPQPLQQTAHWETVNCFKYLEESYINSSFTLTSLKSTHSMFFSAKYLLCIHEFEFWRLLLASH